MQHENYADLTAGETCELADGVALRGLSLDIAPALFALTDANRAFLRQWLPWLDRTVAEGDTRKFLLLCIGQYRGGGGPHFAIYCGGSLAGVCGFHRIDRENRVGSIGYWLAEAFTGRGVMTVAVSKLLELGFNDYGLNRMEIRCAAGNHRSRAIPERLGLALEGTLRQCEWLYDHYVDHAVYALLAAEYTLQQRSRAD